MAVLITCHECGGRYRTEKVRPGAHVKCPKCGARCQAEGAAPPEEQTVDLSPAGPSDKEEASAPPTVPRVGPPPPLEVPSSGLHDDATIQGAPAPDGEEDETEEPPESGPARPEPAPTLEATASQVEAPGEATVVFQDEASAPAAPTPDPSASGPALHEAATLAGDGSASAGPAGREGPPAGAEEAPSAVSASAPGGGATRTLAEMETLWAKTIAQGDRPEQTIKREESEPPARGAGTVSVRPRALAEGTKVSAAELDFEILKILGEGGMGVVYAGRQTSVDRPVAIKMMKGEAAADEAARAKFLIEAVVEGELDHPNIVPVHDLGVDPDGNLFYAMKHVRGTSWQDAIRHKSRQENLEILLKVSDAIAFAHSKDIIHRDLKPENVMLGDFGEALVMDWGLAASVGPKGKAEPITPATSLAGTPAYMAPEMADARVEDIGFGSDIYLLGAILYEIVTGRRPHTGKTVLECLVHAANNEIVPTEESGELVEIALQAMASDPAARHASVAAFQQAIRDYQSHAESVALCEQAHAHLREAREAREYNLFAEALFGFRQAHELWEENDEALAGIALASYDYAECAYERGDYDLAASLLDAEEPSHADLLADVERAARRREARQRRIRYLTYGSVALAAGIFGVVSWAYIAVSAEQARTEQALTRAVAAEEQATQNAQLAEAEADRARQAEVEARAAEERAATILADLTKAKSRGEQEAARARAAELLAEKAQEEMERTGRTQANDWWIFGPEEARRLQEEAAEALGGPVLRSLDVGAGQPLELLAVPADEFGMGSPPREADRSGEEHLHRVRLTRPFYLGRREITRGQWHAVLGLEAPDEPQLPVVEASFRRIQEEFLPALQRFAPAGLRFRLPSEAEWEYACRGGTNTAYHAGSAEDDLAATAWYVANSRQAPHPVGERQPNAFGLFDMHGNAAEWCRDVYNRTYYLTDLPPDPVCRLEGSYRVVRGGSWINLPEHCRSAYRSYAHPDNQYPFLGLRVVLAPPAGPDAAPPATP